MMKKAISSYLFRDSVLGVHLLDQIARAGFECIEIYCSRQHFNYTNPVHVREIAEWFADSPVQLHSLHSPLSRDPEGTSHHSVVSIAFVEKQRRQDSMDEIKRALEVAESVPFRYLVAHLGIPGEEFDLRKFDAAMTSLEHLRLFAGQRGVEIILENIPNELSTPSRLLEFFQHTHLHNMKVCFDCGHAQLDGNPQEALAKLASAVAAVHLNDNGGNTDEHRLPFDGILSWKDFIPELARAAPEAAWLLEIKDADRTHPDLTKAAAVFQRFQAILEEGKQ
ncbi:MAG: sugar phosphate isomerase/epimerase [Acidobacteria bacterium]|nr:sugar phosphate isomerase/epimerase [Acidobacteriota bacterium]